MIKKILLLSFSCIIISAAAQNTTTAEDTLSYTLNEVVFSGAKEGSYISKIRPIKTEVITNAGLCKMACCSLAESFENTASVSVGYSDAISGSRQIRLLGLAGKYTSMLDENRPAMRGLAAPFGLSYIPGQWLESIQIAKGPGSVINGYESIAGQINLELRKPSTEEPLFVNAYIDHLLRTELNVVSSLQLNNKWSTAIFAHGSIDAQKHDDNGDGFMEEPMKKQINFGNRWLYMAENGMQWRFGLSGLYETRDGGQIHFDKQAPRNPATNNYGTNIDNTHINAYSKLGIPLNDDNSANIAIVTDYTYHDIQSFFGVKEYNGTQHAAFLNLMFQNIFHEHHKFVAGLSGQFNDYNEKLNDNWFDGVNPMVQSNILDLSRRETAGGVYGEYTFNRDEKLVFITGMRIDYNNLYKKWLFTPRANLKYDFTDNIILRVSAGRGFRSANIIPDNIGILATGRQIDIADNLQLEDAWTYGGSLMFYFKCFEDERAYISLDYFRTDFINQVLVNQEISSAPNLYDKVHIYNLNGRSFTNAYQIDFSAFPVERFNVTATFRYNDTRADLQGQGLTELPLVDRYKGVLNVQYATRMNKWVFDATAQINGQSRLSNFVYDDQKDHYSPVYPMFFAQITRNFKGLSIYLGVENILNYMQENPILSPNAPYSYGFNSSVIWGPLMGRKFYAGLRYTIFK
ncbi:MAG: TonB-dependent receptor [Bacteroidales bacterium]|nr:TonB-dependent receptor [Bacteroidales bacterium]MCL2133222.1 TonB-dependent receptor [Bacteroidales bacterium]